MYGFESSIVLPAFHHPETRKSRAFYVLKLHVWAFWLQTIFDARMDVLTSMKIIVLLWMCFKTGICILFSYALSGLLVLPEYETLFFLSK